MKPIHILLLALAPLFFSCQPEQSADPAGDDAPAAEAAAEPAAAADPEASPASPATDSTAADDAAAAPAPTPAATANPRVRIVTNKGDIVIELDAAKAPITVRNFLGYVARKHYNGTLFHRVIEGFMIQGGGFTVQGGRLLEKRTGPGVKNESQNGLKNKRGTVAMARTNDPDSATAQFFINVSDNEGLDHPNPDGHGYAVFGRVVEGMDVVDIIKAVPTTTMTLTMLHPVSGQPINQPAPNVPAQPVVITGVTLLDAE